MLGNFAGVFFVVLCCFLSKTIFWEHILWNGLDPDLRSGLTFRSGCRGDELDWLQSLKQFFINVSYQILVASLTLKALF